MASFKYKALADGGHDTFAQAMKLAFGATGILEIKAEALINLKELQRLLVPVEEEKMRSGPTFTANIPEIRHLFALCRQKEWPEKELITAKGFRGYSALHMVILGMGEAEKRETHVEAFQLILLKGSTLDVDLYSISDDYGDTPVMFAVYRNKYFLASELVSRLARTYKDLIAEVYKDATNKRVAGSLLQKNNEGFLPHTMAVVKDNPEMLDLLTRYMPEGGIDVMDAYGSPMAHAIRMKSDKMVDAIWFLRGALPTQRALRAENTPIWQMAIDHGYEHYFEKMRATWLVSEAETETIAKYAESQGEVAIANIVRSYSAAAEEDEPDEEFGQAEDEF